MADKEKKYFRILTEAEQKERSAMIRAGCDRYSVDDCDNYAKFEGLTPQAMRDLIAAGFADPEETQNYSPSIDRMTEFCEKHRGFTMHGYTIGQDRPDARISVEGVEGEAQTLDDMLDFIEEFRDADDFDFDRTSLHCFCWYD